MAEFDCEYPHFLVSKASLAGLPFHIKKYTMTTIPMTADLLRILLALFLAAMYALAILFLRRRQMSLMAYISWGAFALLIPIIGPFLVILVRPGKRRSAPDRAPETGLP